MKFSKFSEGQGMEEWSRRVCDIMDEMLKRHFVEFRNAGAWRPAVNLYETAEAYHVCLDLPGMREDEIEVHCDGQTRVTVYGGRVRPRPADLPADAPLSVHLMEIDEGPFRREIELPAPFEMDAVEAAYRLGFLWITLPKIRKSDPNPAPNPAKNRR